MPFHIPLLPLRLSTIAITIFIDMPSIRRHCYAYFATPTRHMITIAGVVVTPLDTLMISFIAT